MAPAAISEVAPVSSFQPKENGKTVSISTTRCDEWKDSAEIPVIDLFLLQADRAKVVKQIYSAVTEWGFFQILNHGLPLEILEEGVKFFQLPLEIKERVEVSGLSGYVGDCSKQTLLTGRWAETLAFSLEDLDKYVSQVWPDGNPKFRDTAIEFISGTAMITVQMSELIAECLGLSLDFFSQHGTGNRKKQLVKMHCYPACPKPADNMGAMSHTDPSCITVLLQDEVGGLQVEKDGQWIGVKPIKGALVVNIGDTMHAWTNGICKSGLHRVLVNKEAPRFSIATFLNVGDEHTSIYAPDELIDENHPRLYRSYKFPEFVVHWVQTRKEDRHPETNGVRILEAKFKFQD